MTDTADANRLFAQKCDFILAAAEPLQFPQSPLPEVAFIGRSNVGKSSLVNALVGQKKLARTSSTPGRTQQIVFFNLGDRLMLVDLPGYGHAKAPPAEKERWTGLVQTYLRKREALRVVCLLLDGRHEPKENDIEMMELLDRAAVPYRLVLTKMDGVKKSEQEIRVEQIKALATRHPAALPDINVTSAEAREGIEDLRLFLGTYTGVV